MIDVCSTTGGSEPNEGCEFALDVGSPSTSEAGGSAPLEDFDFTSAALDCTVSAFNAPEIDINRKNGSVSWVSDIASLRYEFADWR